ncbi:MAG TPA: ATP-binding protein, partial [Pirellulaceae bacterium]|nr:ATP-binding protein [Pirellulaceae bacterium]
MHMPIANSPSPLSPFRDDNARLLAELSHEIRTPLTAMLGYVEILLEEAEQLEFQAPARGALEIIGSSSRHLLDLVNGLLDWARLDAGGNLKPRPADPLALADEVLMLLQSRVSSPAVQLRLEHDASVPAELLTDPLRLRQILLNLVGNALKFTTFGEVRLVVSAVALSPRKTRLVIDVIDTGVGLTAEEISHLFRPFSQPSAHGRSSGTGLGLVISQRLCRLLGGQLTVHSVPGVGSTFRVELPCDLASNEESEDSREPLPAAPCAGQPLSGYKILLAEDHLETRRLLGIVLRKAGAELTEVTNGDEACAIALAARRRAGSNAITTSQPFDVVILDRQMPLCDGITAARQLR